MGYIEKNKGAWEETFDSKVNDWGDTVAENLQASSAYYIQPALQTELDQLNLAGKHVAQLCYGNGRELLSISRHYRAVGTSSNIAGNLIAQGKVHARQLHVPYSFSAMDILDIGNKYHQEFDMILFTIGVVTWFRDVNALFRVVSDCLKPRDIMLIHDFHPLMNTLPLPGEGCYCDNVIRSLEHKHFTTESWIGNNGMGYISGDYASKTFTSFSRSISELVNGTIQSSISVRLLNGYDYDIGLSDVYDAMGLPLSMLLIAGRV